MPTLNVAVLLAQPPAPLSAPNPAPTMTPTMRYGSTYKGTSNPSAIQLGTFWNNPSHQLVTARRHNPHIGSTHRAVT